MATTDINTRASLIIYLCICGIMFMFVMFGKYAMSEHITNNNNYFWSKVKLFGLFWITTFIGQLSMNGVMSKQQISCTSDNSYSGNNPFLITLMPWIFVLGLFMVLLFFIPGLLRIFSNTIGMAIVYDKFKADITNTINAGNQLTPNNLKEIYIKISNEPQLIINEIEYSNDTEFEEIYIKYSKIFPLIFITNDGDVFKNKIRQLIISKNIIGYAIWIALIGTISSLISTSAMINVSCS